MEEANNFFWNLKVTVSSFFSFLLMQRQSQTPPLSQTLPLSISGLRTLISPEEPQEMKDRVIRRVRGRSNLLTRSSSFCNSIPSCDLFMDDLIGTESGVCLTTNHQEIADSDSDYLCNRRRCAAEKPFPPPIPFLGHRTRPAWILARNSVDGRLILKLKRVRDHQALESHRQNGRLILNLVPTPVDALDDHDQDLQFVEEVAGEESIQCQEDSDSDFDFKSFTYGGGGGGGMYFDRERFCGVNGDLEGRHVVHGHFGSAPLRPMGTVM